MRRGATKSCGCVYNRPPQEDPRFIEMTGQKFNRLLVIGFDHKNGSRKCFWKCRCDCGNTAVVDGTHLRMGVVGSCGCYHLDRASEANTTHGMTGSKIHRAWKNMIQRCTNPHNGHWADYGGRGITVCDAWKDSFQAFYKDVGDPPTPDHEIDRKDNNLGYMPDNVRWATLTEQTRNRRTTINVTIGGIEHNLQEACNKFGVNYFAAYHAIIRKGVNADTIFKQEEVSKEPTITNGLEEISEVIEY